MTVRTVWGIALGCLLTAIGTACRPLGQRQAESSDQTSSPLAVVLRALAERTRLPVLVDPRPMRVGETPSPLDTSIIAATHPEELRSRRASIQALGYTLTDVLTLPPCGGASAIFSPRGIHRGCPPEAIGIVLTASVTAAERGEADTATVPALVEERYPQGAALMWWDVMLVRRGDRWMVSKVTLANRRE